MIELHIFAGGNSIEHDHVAWFSAFGLIFLSFYIFTSPFVGNRELLKKWTPYVYFSMGLHSWLLTAAALNIPLHTLGLLDYNVKRPVSLFFPIFFATLIILLLFEFILIVTKKVLKTEVTFINISFARSSFNVLRNSAAIALACCVLFVHCDGMKEVNDDDEKSYNQHACEHLFDFTESPLKIPLPSSYRGALFIWFTGIILAMINFFLERLIGIPGIVLGISENSDYIANLTNEDQLEKPTTHPMVSWYSMFMFDMGFQLLLSLKVFLGRFDMRVLQTALTSHEDPPLFDHLSQRNHLWLDFMADCGDGFNSSYQISRLLAQPELDVVNLDGSYLTLPRAQLLILGGDLAYPYPTASSYELRFWKCFEYAMAPPSHYDPRRISVNKPDLPSDCKCLKEYPGPTAFAIPGNHDWFDGLSTFLRYICHRDWLGGWLLPQKTSFFALKLPHRWWLFGCDLALENDIDLQQYQFFSKTVEEKMGLDDAVILVTHEPGWILEVYENKPPPPNLSHLIDGVLKGRLALRLAGDLHHYTRHSPILDPHFKRPAPISTYGNLSPLNNRTLKNEGKPDSPVSKYFFDDKGSIVRKIVHEEKGKHQSPVRRKQPLRKRRVPELIVSGGGGAFLHPTHVPTSDPIPNAGYMYQRVAAYPPEHISKRYALLNIFGFRKRNWRFDLIGGLQYFILVFSMFPRCNIDIIKAHTWMEGSKRFLRALCQVQTDLLLESYVSLFGFVALIVIHIRFADGDSVTRRMIAGFLHSFAHNLAASCVLLSFETIVQAAIDSGAVTGDGNHTLFEYLAFYFKDDSYDQYKGAMIARYCLKRFMTFFDVPEVMAYHRGKICSNGFATLTRTEYLGYYSTVFAYFWICATPVVSFVFGTYLYIAINYFKCHYNEAFSSLKVASYKNFVRMHINKDGDLEVYSLGVDKMPQKWVRDTEWSGSRRERLKHGNIPSYQWKFPSCWKPLIRKVDNILRWDFEDRSRDARLNADDRSKVKLIDSTQIMNSYKY